MNNQEAVIWGYTGKRWTKRKHVTLTGPGLSCADMDTLNDYDKQHGGYHSFLPPGINPNNHAVINQMRAIAEKNVKSYIADFYHIDVHQYFRFNQSVIWMTRESGTNIYPAHPTHAFQSEQQRNNACFLFNYYVDQDRSTNKLYLVDKIDAVALKTEKARIILESIPVLEVSA